MSIVARLLPDNPVLTKELRVRMRGARAFWILFGYLGFLSAIMLFNYWAWLSNVQQSGGASEASRLGGEIFQYLLVTQLFLVLFITPAITSGALTMEREQQTMDMLSMTRLPRRSIIAGKLLSAVLFTALLLTSSLPLVSVCFMLGSVDPAMVWSYYAMLLTGSFLIGALGLMWSSIAKGTTQAVMLTYGSLFLLFVGGAIAWGTSTAPQFLGLLTAIGATSFGESFLGLRVPQGLGFNLLSVVAGLLFASVAMVRLEVWPERRAGLLRGMTLLLVGMEVLSIDLWWLQAWFSRAALTIQTVTQPPIAALALPALIVMALVPTFATGEIRLSEARKLWRYLARGWTPRGLRRGTLASGPAFLILLSVVTLGLYVSSFVFVGKAKDVLASGATAAAGNTAGTGASRVTSNYRRGTLSRPPGVAIAPGTNPGAPASPGFTQTRPAGDFPEAAIAILSSVTGFSLFCMFLSVLIRNRWAALTLAYVLALAGLIIPEVSHSPIYLGSGPWPGISLYYLDPLQALAQMADSSNYYNNTLLASGWLLFGDSPMWLGTFITWTVIGIVSFALTHWCARKIKTNVGPTPYEELVGEA